MRKFTNICIDSITGMTMVLSDCSYNMACAYLETQKDAIGECISATMTRDNMTRLKFPEKEFYYDESRGYLMQKH